MLQVHTYRSVWQMEPGIEGLDNGFTAVEPFFLRSESGAPSPDAANLTEPFILSEPGHSVQYLDFK